MTTEAVEIEEAEHEVSFICACCEEPQDANAICIEVHGYGTRFMNCCEACVASYVVWSAVSEEYVHCDHAITARDTGNAVHERYANNNWTYDSVDGEWYEDADNAPSRQERATYSYHETNPIELFGWPEATPKNSLCFGVELEMEARSDSEAEDDDDGADEGNAGQDSISEALGGRNGGAKPEHFILMNDGSLNDSGVELITSPFTLDYHQAEFEWSKVLGKVSDIAKSGCGTNRCGMHVHVNRKAISALTLGKMLVFVNSDANDRLIERIAQRDSSRWAKRYTKQIKQGAEVESDKYEALHLSSRTIEFRIFRGNLRSDRVLKNIEFCHSVVTYCKQAGMKQVTGYSDYIAWLGKNRGMYPNLVAFLGESYGFKINKQTKTNKEI